MPFSPSGIPVEWNNFFQPDATSIVRIRFTEEETQKISDYARSLGVAVNSVIVSAILLAEYNLFGTDEHKKWAAVQVIDYRNHVKPRLAPTDGTNIVGWHPELYPVHPEMTEKELSSIVWERLIDTVKNDSVINNTVNFSTRMNTQPDIKQLEKVESKRSASIISNIGNLPRIPESSFQILDMNGYVLSIGPRLFYLVYAALNKLSIMISYPGNGFIAENDIVSLKKTLIHRLTHLA